MRISVIFLYHRRVGKTSSLNGDVLSFATASFAAASLIATFFAAVSLAAVNSVFLLLTLSEEFSRLTARRSRYLWLAVLAFSDC